jgi:hypothetical protein
MVSMVKAGSMYPGAQKHYAYDGYPSVNRQRAKIGVVCHDHATLGNCPANQVDISCSLKTFLADVADIESPPAKETYDVSVDVLIGQ